MLAVSQTARHDASAATPDFSSRSSRPSHPDCRCTASSSSSRGSCMRHLLMGSRSSVSSARTARNRNCATASATGPRKDSAASDARTGSHAVQWSAPTVTRIGLWAGNSAPSVRTARGRNCVTARVSSTTGPGRTRSNLGRTGSSDYLCGMDCPHRTNC